MTIHSDDRIESTTGGDYPSSAALDSAHVGDIVGAFGRIDRHAGTDGRSRRQQLRMLLVILGPGLVAMVGDNDAGGVATYAQAGQNYGMKLAWTLVLLIPVLYVNQEMVVRLGAVTGVGHARLIFQRFGKFWGAFSLGDLLILNALTIVTEFIGVTMALGYFGIERRYAVPLAALALFSMVAMGSFRRWERFLFALIAINLVVIPLAVVAHPHLGTAARGFVPGFPGGLHSTLLLFVVSIVGTTVAPWQLFFQQSNIVDKRITPRWIRYERADLGIGMVVVLVGGLAIMGAATCAFAGTHDAGAFTDAAGVAHGLAHRLGSGAGTLFAILLLDASLIGANAVGLATIYSLGDAFGKRHSLHWKISQAPGFYAGYAILLGVAAAVSFSPDNVLGLITQGVQALAGVLLPSATVFLVLLCNDRPVLGPWVNTLRQNIIAGTIVWTLVLLSLALTASTFFPQLPIRTVIIGMIVGAVTGVVGAVAIALGRRRQIRARALRTAAQLGDLDPDQVEEPDTAGLTRAERTALRRRDRMTWHTPVLTDLAAPSFSPLRRAGLLTLRAYLVVAVALVVVKIVQSL